MVPIQHEELVVLMEAGYVYLGMGRHEEARELFEGVSALVPESEIPLVAIGSVLFAQKKYDGAIQSYRKALNLKKESPYARAYLGEALFFKGKKEEALTELEKAVTLDSSGKCGEFARSLIDAIKKGFAPPDQLGHH